MQFSWSLGGIMLYCNLLPWKYEESNLYKYLFISSVVIIGILILIICILLCLMYNKYKSYSVVPTLVGKRKNFIN